MQRTPIKKVALFLFVAVATCVVGSIAACSYTSHVRNTAFDAVQMGDTQASVIARFGTQPSVRETPDALFTRYASGPCDQCVERIWFENRLSLDVEAWSLELDGDGRVMGNHAGCRRRPLGAGLNLVAQAIPFARPHPGIGSGRRHAHQPLIMEEIFCREAAEDHFPNR